jgi:threonine dehydrogenase-like Zn-dependent dehydrogenase
VETILLGLCGTDRDLLLRKPRAERPLIVGHEVVGRAIESQEGIAAGTLVVGLARRPCPERCGPCTRGEIDFCSTLPPVERGIWRADGFGSERWTSPPDFLIPVPADLGELGVLVEPASCVFKGLRRLRILSEADSADRALVLGAGPIGCLAALALSDRGMDVDVKDPWASASRAEMLRSIGGRAVSDRSLGRSYALVVEASGSAAALTESFDAVAPNGSILVLGVASRRATIANPSELLQGNVALMFSVNAAREDYQAAMKLLDRTDKNLLAGLIGRQVAPAQWVDALEPHREIVKSVVRFAND